MGFIRILQNLRSDDPYVVAQAARALGELRDSEHISSLVEAADGGGYSAFRERPQEIPARRNFGGYRDKIAALAEALWMIGDQEGLCG